MMLKYASRSEGNCRPIDVLESGCAWRSRCRGECWM